MTPSAHYVVSTILATLLASVPVTAQTEDNLPAGGAETRVEVRQTLKIGLAPVATQSIVLGSLEPLWKGHRISLSLKDADLRDVLRSFAKLGHFNLVLDPSVQGKVTLELRNVPWDQALSVILKTHGLAAEGAVGRLLFPVH